MGAGTLNLYDAKGHYIGKRGKYAVYKYRGNYYMLDGTAWTGWKRINISKEAFERVTNWAVANAETYEIDRLYTPTRAQLARRTLRITPPYTIKWIIRG